MNDYKTLSLLFFSVLGLTNAGSLSAMGQPKNIQRQYIAGMPTEFLKHAGKTYWNGLLRSAEKQKKIDRELGIYLQHVNYPEKRVIERHIEKGANINAALVDAIIHRSSSISNPYTIQLLANCKANLNTKVDKITPSDMDGQRTVLHLAVTLNKQEFVQSLLDNKAHVDMIDETKRSPLVWACKEGNKRIARILIEKNADVNTCSDDIYGTTPLHAALWKACEMGDTSPVQYLLENKAQVDALRGLRNNPLLEGIFLDLDNVKNVWKALIVWGAQCSTLHSQSIYNELSALYQRMPPAAIVAYKQGLPEAILAHIPVRALIPKVTDYLWHNVDNLTLLRELRSNSVAPTIATKSLMPVNNSEKNTN